MTGIRSARINDRKPIAGIRLVLTGLIVLAGVFAFGAAQAAAPAVTETISMDQSGHPVSGGSSMGASVSGNGRFVAFQSNSPNLIPGIEGQQIYVRDRLTGTMRLASAGIDGFPGNGRSLDPVMSENGRFIAFSSEASNLTSDVRHARVDIFVRDIELNATELVSVGTIGSPLIISFSESPVINADGSIVGFTTHECFSNVDCVVNAYIRNRVTRTTELVGVDNGDNPPLLGPGYSNAYIESISGDGTKVVFLATQALGPDGLWSPGYGDGAGSIYLRDRQQQKTSLVSAARPLAQAASASGSLSSDGRFVGYASDDLTSCQNPPYGCGQIVVADLQTGSTRVVASDFFESQSGTSTLSINGDGSELTYKGLDGLIWALDVSTGAREVVSVALDGSLPDGASDAASVSEDGRFVVFESSASNLVEANTSTCPGTFVPGHCGQVYIRDRCPDESCATRPPIPPRLDYGRSTITAAASPTVADCTRPPTVTVTLVDSNGNPWLQSTVVSVISSRGAVDGILEGAMTTTSGSAVFHICTSQPGTATFFATANGLPIIGNVSITFEPILSVTRVEMVSPKILDVDVGVYPRPNQQETAFVDPQLALPNGSVLTHAGCATVCTTNLLSGTGAKQVVSFRVDLQSAGVPRFSDNVTFGVHACLGTSSATIACGDAQAKILLPVVLVHGIVEDSSIWNSLSPYMQTAGDVEPDVGQASFAGSGYSESGTYPTLTRFTYNSLTESNETSAANLRIAVQSELAKTYATRVTIIAHSMGGNISRYYINSLGGAPIVKRIAMLGAPIEGSAQAALGRIALTVCSSFLGSSQSCGNLLGAFCGATSLAQACQVTMQQLASTGKAPPALDELLPTYSYYRTCPATNQCTPYEIRWVNRFLTRLNASNPAVGPEYCEVYGDIASAGSLIGLGPNDTAERISETSKYLIPGVLPAVATVVDLANGDHWVPVRSARAADTLTLQQSIHMRDVGPIRHGDLPTALPVMQFANAFALGSSSC